MIWETFKSLVVFPVFLVLWLFFGLSVVFGLRALDVPFVTEYFGILVMLVLTGPIVVLFYYVKRKQSGE